MLVSIGQFSRITRLSVKALRLYDQIGLLVPARVDPSTGYRYYESAQASRAEAVRLLRSLDMPLEAIRTVIGAEPAKARSALVEHRHHLADRLEAHKRMLAFIDQLITQKESLVTYDVQLKQVAPQRILATRKHTTMAQVSGAIAEGIQALMPQLAAAPCTPKGDPMVIYHTAIDAETAGDIEIGYPVGSEIETAGEVYTRELEGGAMATATHCGPYEQLASVYHAIGAWIDKEGHSISGPPREFYLNDPRSIAPEGLLTRVEFPVAPTTPSGEGAA